VYKADCEHEIAKNIHTTTYQFIAEPDKSTESVFYKNCHSTVCPFTSKMVIPVQSITSGGKQYIHNEEASSANRSRRIPPLSKVKFRVASEESIGIPVKNVNEYSMGCTYLGLLHFLILVLVLKLCGCYKVSIQ
jgi:hypothetical protein